MLAVLLPSRGLVRSELVEALDNELSEFKHKKFYTHDMPIPDCFNYLAETAHTFTEVTHFWFVEEDVIPPPQALQQLLDLDSDIAFLDYPLVKFPSPQCFKVFQGGIIWVGMGCTLIKRRVLDGLPRPWFKSNYQLVAKMNGSQTRDYVLDLQESDRKYGGQDIYFCTKALQAGYDIDIVPKIQCKHLPIGQEGKDFYETNFKNKHEE